MQEEHTPGLSSFQLPESPSEELVQINSREQEAYHKNGSSVSTTINVEETIGRADAGKQSNDNDNEHQGMHDLYTQEYTFDANYRQAPFSPSPGTLPHLHSPIGMAKTNSATDPSLWPRT